MTSYNFAGQWGPQPITNAAGVPLKNLSVTIFEHGTDTMATLYTDRTKDSTTANPFETDSIGNLTFFVDPGQYDIVGNEATITVPVYIDPQESGTGDVEGVFPGPLVLEDTTNVQSVIAAAGATAGFATTSAMNTALALKAPLASPALTGSPTAPTQTALDDTTKVATTAYTDTAVGVETSARTTAVALKAPLASPTLTGTPAAPTASLGTNTTQLATTAFVAAAHAPNWSVPTPTTTVAFTPSTTQNGVLGIFCTTGATSTLKVTIGPSTGAENTWIPTISPNVAGATAFSIPVPAGWKVIITATIADFSYTFLTF